MKRIFFSFATFLVIFTGAELFMPSLSEARTISPRNPCVTIECELVSDGDGGVVVDTENPAPPQPGFLHPVEPTLFN